MLSTYKQMELDNSAHIKESSDDPSHLTKDYKQGFLGIQLLYCIKMMVYCTVIQEPSAMWNKGWLNGHDDERMLLFWSHASHQGWPLVREKQDPQRTSSVPYKEKDKRILTGVENPLCGKQWLDTLQILTKLSLTTPQWESLLLIPTFQVA